jgi:hypothetical protein
VVFGNLRTETFTHPVQIDVFDSHGKRFPPMRVFYFDDKNVIRYGLRTTDVANQNFVIANLTPGEWQVVVTDPQSHQGLATQIVRVEDDTVTQIQF